MFVKSAMIPKEKCFTIQLSDSVKSALDLLELKQVDALPVLNGKKYVGIVTRFHAYRAFYLSNQDKETFLQQTAVSDIITRQETFVNIEDVFEKSLIALNDFPIIAVVDKDNFLGIVTRYDIVNQFNSAFGVDQPGVRITFTSLETDGRISKLADIIQKFNESVISIVTFDETDKLLRRIVLKIEKKDNVQKFLNELDRSGFRVLHMIED